MSLPEDTQKLLRGLIEKDPSLLAQLQQVDDVAAAARILTQAAAATGLAVDEDTLRNHLAASVQQAGEQALSDAQLSQVAGGVLDRTGFILLSALTFGIGCAGVSVAGAIVKAAGGPIGEKCWQGK
jgi:hypothetical protein